MSKITIGQKLRQLRENSGYNAKEVSLMLQRDFSLNIQYKTIYNYENGRNSPDTDVFLALCIIYDCEDILYEFGYTDVPQKYPRSSEASKIYSKYRQLSKDGKNIIRGALGIEKDELDDLPAPPEEFEKHYPPVEPNENKEIG